MKQKNFHFLYKTFCNTSGRYYIGIRSTNDINKDSYLGSGKIIVAMIKQYGKKNFRREILCIAGTREYVIRLERLMVDAKTLSDPLCINLAEGGLGGAPGVKKTSEHVAKIAAKTRGLKRTPEQIERMREAQKGRIPWNRGKHGLQKRRHSEESLAKMRKPRKSYNSKWSRFKANDENVC